MRAPNPQKGGPIKPWLKQRYCIPPQASARFVYHMEEVLDVYRRRYHPKRPLVCLDEVSMQLLADTLAPLPMGPDQPRREDYEYTRKGTANVFMLCAPLVGWRHVQVRRFTHQGGLRACDQGLGGAVVSARRCHRAGAR